MVLDRDSNTILTYYLKYRSNSEVVYVYTTIYTYLTAHGLTSTIQIMDNEYTAGLRNYMGTNEVEYQLVPLHY